MKFYFCVYCTDILRKFDDMIEVILPQLPTSFDTITDPEGKAALLWILGEYGEVGKYAPSITKPNDCNRFMLLYLQLFVFFDNRLASLCTVVSSVEPVLLFSYALFLEDVCFNILYHLLSVLQSCL